jgi:hypothetical protein
MTAACGVLRHTLPVRQREVDLVNMESVRFLCAVLYDPFSTSPWRAAALAAAGPTFAGAFSAA